MYWYYITRNSSRKRYDDFNNGKELLKSKWKYQEGINQQKRCIKKYWIVGWVTKAVIELFNDYSSIISEAKYK